MSRGGAGRNAARGQQSAAGVNRPSGLLALGWLLAGCAAAASRPAAPASDADSPGPAAHAAQTEAVEPVAPSDRAPGLGPELSLGEVNADAALPEVSAASEQGAAEADELEPREVLYRVGPDGLVIEIEGVRLTPSAQVLRKPNGGYGVRLRLVVEDLVDDAHVLLVPELGPLSMAASVFDAKGNRVAQHGDVREGGEYVLLGPGSKQEFTREWPSGNVQGPLWWGRRLHLEVGLWGLGRNEQEQRPVRKLFQLDMTVNANPRALITPPRVP